LTFDAVAIEVCWNAPTENVDGSALTDLDGYEVYWGDSSRNYSASSGRLPLTPTCYDWEPAAGDYFIAATAFDIDGNESAYSNEVVRAQEDTGGDPNAPVVWEDPTQEGSVIENAPMLVGITGQEVTVTWGSFLGVIYEIQLVEYGKDTPVGAIGLMLGSIWTFTPTAAGLYQVRIRVSCTTSCGAWQYGYTYFFKLAPPTGGGIS